jgi:ferredoxin
VHIEIDGDLCTGHGRCYALAPELFGCDDDGHAEVLVEVRGDAAERLRSADLTEDQLPKAKLAVDNCPEVAISLVD